MQQIKNMGLTESVLHFKNVPDSLLYSYYSLADLYVSSSLQNCLLISVLEAMACGLPVVATDYQEGALEEGINGYIVPPRNSLAIADAVIKSFDRNELKRMGARSKEIAKNYDWKIIAKKAIKEYERIIASR
jgi:glycosyltransferase involved in cell wall biosynthesis